MGKKKRNRRSGMKETKRRKLDDESKSADVQSDEPSTSRVSDQPGGPARGEQKILENDGENNGKRSSYEPKTIDLSGSLSQDAIKVDLQNTDIGEDTDKRLEVETITIDLPTSSSQDALTDYALSADISMTSSGNEVSPESNNNQPTGIAGTSDINPSISAITENFSTILNEAVTTGVESQNQRNINIEPGVSTSGLNIAPNLSSKIVFRNEPSQSTPDIEPTNIIGQTTASSRTEANSIEDVPSTSTVNKPLQMRKVFPSKTVSIASKEEEISELRVMISYKWGDTYDLATKIHQKLEGYKLKPGLTIKVLRDEEQFLSGGLPENITKTLDDASIVLIFDSPHYYSSTYCRREVIYVVEHKNIPRIFLRCYKKKSRDTMDFLRGSDLYCDFSDGKYSEAPFQKLLHNIENQWDENFSEGKLTREQNRFVQKIDNSHIDQDLHSTEDEHCNALQNMLKEAAKISSDTDDSPLFDGKHINRVALEIITGTNSQHLVHQSRHYHQREDFEKLYVTPKGTIGLKDLLPCSLKEAEKEAEWCCHGEEAKSHFVRIHGNVVGIIGEAGIGKTTLSKMFTQNILDGLLGNFNYIFYISVRKVNFNVKTNVLQFLVESATSDSPSQEWDNNIMKNMLKILSSSAEVIIILDGLDEAAISDPSSKSDRVDLNEEATAEFFIKSLLSGSLLPDAKKVITSRPSQLYDLHEACRPHFIANVLGLSKEAQLDLCRQICGDDAAKVIQFLKGHPDIFSYCYVPVNCIITMNAIHEVLTDPEMKQNLITMTAIMTYNIEKYAGSLHIRLEKERIEKELKKLCKLAWNGILNKKLIFMKGDTNNVGIDDVTLNAFMCTHLNTKLGNKLLDGAKQFYFSHLIWQEFFSAIHVMLFMSFHEFKKHQKSLKDSKWQKVLQFIFGVCSTETHSQLLNIFPLSGPIDKKWKVLKTIASELLSSWKADDESKQLFQLCVLVHEAQDKVLRDEISAALPSDIILSGSLLPSDVTSLDYVLSGRSTNLNMSLEYIDFVEESCKIFFDKMATSECRNNIQMPKVRCEKQKIDDDSAKSLAACLSQIQELSLIQCELSASGVEYISSGIRKLEKQMELLDLRYNRIGDKGAEYLSSCLKNINQLNIFDCKITDAGVKHLSTAISELSRPMELLDLGENPIGEKGAEYLSSCLKNINQLEIHKCKITDAGVKHLSTAISELSRPMEQLHLSLNPFGDKGAEYLSSCLKNINQLDIHKCNITDAGVHHLSMAISELSRPMKLLCFPLNPIGDKGAEYLSSCLKNINRIIIYINQYLSLQDHRC